MRRRASAAAEKAVAEKAVAARPQGKSAGGFMAALAEAAKAKSDTGSGAEGGGPATREKRRQTRRASAGSDRRTGTPRASKEGVREMEWAEGTGPAR